MAGGDYARVLVGAISAVQCQHNATDLNHCSAKHGIQREHGFGNAVLVGELLETSGRRPCLMDSRMSSMDG